MAQLRHDYQEFIKRDAEIIVVGPETDTAFNQYWNKNNFKFIGIPDPKHTVLKLFGQKVNLFKLGRMPAQMIIDKAGFVRTIHYGHDMTDIPANEDIFSHLDKLNESNE